MKFVRRALPIFHFLADSVSWGIGVLLVSLLSSDDGSTRFTFAEKWGLFAAAIGTLIVAGYVGGLYRSRWRYGSFDEVVVLGVTMTVVGVVETAFAVVVLDAPALVPVTAYLLAMSFSVGGRSAWRLWRSRSRGVGEAIPLVVIGAGQAGEDVVRSLTHDRSAGFRPVAFVDDDPLKANLRINGVPVLGTTDQLAEVATRVGAKTALLAIANASSDLRTRVASTPQLELLTIRPHHDRFTSVNRQRLERFTEEDLLGRPQVDIDVEAVQAFVRNKRILVTGAGGSIGSELCRQLSAFGAQRVIMLDRDETGLHATLLSMTGSGQLDDPRLVLADIRDIDRLREVFAVHRPDVVFHSAALKHLTLLEAAPEEAWKTNVVGTHNVLTVAKEFGVESLVNISTDKAADPSSVLGWSKRLTERLTAAVAEELERDASRSGGEDHPPRRFVSVRFGNVLGSRGSVLTTFREQIARGGPLRVSHPDVSRFFMTINEAAKFSIYAGAIGRSGEVLILDMGQPVKIADLASLLARRRRPPIPIEFTGLRPGEKLHESLWGRDEKDRRDVHPLVSHVRAPSLAWETCESMYRRHGSHFDPEK